ncbi:type I polyketide synthase [Nonomuraea sp. ZG12]|uniref:type I polyketide synthase n=1 Tax=Nonomuraea sp. ZG12 TaxID=3452207 RepID=UPI003F8C5FC5
MAAVENEDKLRDYLKQVTTTLRRTRKRLRDRDREPIAIVGMGCRFPGGVREPEDFWNLLSAGTDAISGFPSDRGWDPEGLYAGAGDEASTTRVGGFLYDAADFDPGFFGISPREAITMDPQQRLLLETAWEAVERAGIDPASLKGTQIGVFAGAGFGAYGHGLAEEGGSEGYLMIGSLTSVISGRVSYTLGLEGPAVTVDTACSSSLVALHLACQALRSRECSMALAGGVAVMSTPSAFAEFSRQQGLAFDGRCKAFAADADGIGWGEGAGMLFLERLSDARRKGHRVLAVIAGSAMNQDGASNGLTAPNGPSQQRVIRTALANAGLRADQVDAVEAHGTGTVLGDPIEAQALLATYGQDREDDRPLWLGSVKSNIGHTQTAAGVAGVIKMVLALQHQELPRTLHAEEPSPHVDWTAGDVRLLTEPVAWPANGRPRRAGVSAFGVSGTNVHAILEEAPPVTDVDADPDDPEPEDAGQEKPGLPVLTGSVLAWLVSGRSPAGLAAQAGRLGEFVLSRPDLDVAGVAWSLISTRSVFEHRAVILGQDRGELLSGLSAVAAGQPAAGVVSGVVPAGGGQGRVVFVFPGQGSQWVGMGRELAEASPVFAARLAECEQALAPYVTWSLNDVLAGREGAPGFDRVDVVQPVLWAVMVSLAAVWQAAGVEPDAVVGHSQGEIAAAVVAGILSLEDAAKIVALRSRALIALSGRGGMLSIAEPAAAVERRVAPWDGRASVAAVNGPAATVVSGDPEALRTLLADCERDGVRARILPVDYASHGPQVDSLREEILNLLDGVAPQPGRVPMVSAMTGEILEGPEMDAGYWYASLRAGVQFSRAIEALDRTGHGVYVEVSAHPVLTASIAGTLEELANPEEAERLSRPAPIVTGTLRRDDGGPARLLASLAEAHVRGVPVDWTTVVPAAPWVELPTYAFQRQRYWPKPVPAPVAVSGGGGTAAEARFWSAVEAGDLDGLSQALSVDGTTLGELVPALASWRRRERDESLTADWRYRVSWVPVRDPAPAALTGTWLVVVPSALAGGDLVSACARALSERGARVLFAEVAPGEVTRSGLAETISGALAPVTDDGGPAGVLSLLGLDESPLADRPVVPSGVAGTLGLLQALGDAGTTAPLWVLTQGAVTTGDGDVLTSPIQAQVWGLGRTAGVEHPDRWGGLIDLPPVLDERSAARLAGVLAGKSEDQAAIRAGGTLARRLVRAAPRRNGDGAWAPRGTILLTGASGAIGPDLAAWLTDAGVEHAVLTSRRGPGTPGAGVLAAFLAEAGSAVTMVACDVVDRDALAGLLAWIPTVASPLSAVIHAAVAVELMALDQADVDQLALALSAKVAGATHLDELTADLDLDAFVLFSSITATWGVGEHGTYAAANAHLDALAENRRARGLPATSVAWGVWSSGGRFDDSANAAQDPAEPARPQSLVPDRLRRQGLRLLDPERALTVLGQVLADDETVLSVADVDWPRFSAVFNAVRSWPLLEEIPEARQVDSGATVVASGEAAALLARLAGVSAGQRERIVTDLVGGHAAAVLGHAPGEAVEANRAFREMGFDSLTAVELRGRLNQATGLQLPSTVVFDYPSPVMLARQIVTQLMGTQQLMTAGSRVTPVSVTDPVVIVGMGCRYPGGVDSPEAMWKLLASGGDAIGGFPADRGWDIAGLLDAVPGSALGSVTREGGFVAGAADFDPAFFRISPREALAMDPQQRLLLETAWEALERTGLDPMSLRGSLTGVFAGAASSGYAGQTGYGADLDGSEGHLITGNVTSVISGRISYTLGLEGPAVTVDTACSSALVSLHLAAQALRAGECDLALAGGVMVIADPAEFIGFSQQGALALDGRCKAFSAGADGMGLSEGAGMIVLERLSDARRNGHTVLAVVAGSAINQDGASNGLTAPNGPSQQRVIRAALASAGLGTADVDAVEAHGTGTRLGDPIEAQALLATYGQDRPEGRPLWLGTVKSNIGHAQQASGAAGIIKMVLALRNGLLPATLHADEATPEVDWTAGDVRLLTEPVDWAAGDRPRRAGVSAFGISGTNVHVILEEAPAASDVEEGAPARAGFEDGAPARAEVEDGAPVRAGVGEEVPALVGVGDGSAHAGPAPALSGTPAWLVSSQAASGLVEQARRLAEHLADRPDLDPVDVGWSLATTRSLFEHRAVITGADRDELVAGLGALAADEPAAGVVTGVAGGTGPVVFVFPGQGSQWAGMGRELAASSPVFAARLAECGRALAPYVDWSLDDVLHGREGAPGLDRVDVVQPALWAVMVSLAEFWQAAGVTPDAVLGHSQGEIAAAVVAGILSLEDAAKVVALRSRALTALSGHGGMMSLAEPAEAVSARIASWDGRISVAAVNGPAATVVSGRPEALAALLAAAERDGVRARMLPVDYASHGPQVDAIRDEVLSLLATITPRPGLIPMVSAMTGEFLTGPELDAGYWYASLRAPVEFARATEVLGRAGYGVFIETSAHPVLTAAITDTLEDLRQRSETDEGSGPVREPVVTGTLRRDDGGPVRALTSLALVHGHGVFVDWTAVLPAGRRIDLPTYAFQRQRYWPKPATAPTATSVVPAAESAFWAAVEGGDLDGLAQTLAVDGQRLGEILPALAAWRHRERGESTAADWRYRITWAPVTVPGSAALSGTWLLVVPAGETGTDQTERCVQALTGHGAQVLRAEIAPDETDRQALAGRISETLHAETDPDSGPVVAGVVSLLALDESPMARWPVVATGLAGTMGLVQALGDAGIGAPLWVLTFGAVAAGAGEVPTGPVQAQTWAFGRVAGLEHPDRWGGLIDLPRAWDARAAGRLAAVLAGCGEDQVAIRAGGVLGRRLMRAPRPRPGDRWQPGGSVLVTGGTGGVGGHVARWLTGRGATRLVLSSRSGPAAAGAPALAAELAAAGTAVAVVAGDVGERSQVTGLVNWIGATGPRLSSVMHAAGAGLGGPIDDMAASDLAEVSQAKAGGAGHLDEATDGLDLDAFVVFSSGAAAWGSGRLAGYAAANAALDALVEDRRGRGLAGTSIAWGLWGGGGMGDGPAGEVLQRLGVREMDPEPAIAALAGALDAGEALVAVSDIDWARFAPVFTVQRPSPLLADLPDAQRALNGLMASDDGAKEAGTALGQRLLGLNRPEQDRILTDLVRAEAAAVLGHASAEAVPAGRAFKDLGFDSLTAVDLRTRLNTATGLKLPATLVFDHPTPAAVVQLLRAELLGARTASAPPTHTAVDPGEPIAIVGIGCRFPGGAGTPESFWELLATGTDAVSGFPADRGWDVERLYGDGTSTTRQGGFVYDASGFDAGFFGISPREALAMDPQQRLLLETTWEALERAGIDPVSLRGSQTGVFAGATYSAYGAGLAESGGSEGYMLTGNATSVISGRISYTLGLEGPAVTVDTACSSSLVALHLAGQALHAGECSLALAGGVTVMATPGAFAEFARQQGLAANGRCKSFGADADGTGWGEGAGVLVLERLSDARRHGHQVLAVIRGSAVNQDGASNGLTAPNGPSQQRVIRAALAAAGLAASDVDAVEAHGTGTVLGDPIEAQALLATYGQDRAENRPLWLGSVKSNIGHTQAAAGVAGVIKMVLALRHDALPVTLFADEPSPHVDWSAGDVRLLTEPVAWPATGRPRRAGVSAFGVSGTNAHVIVEEPPALADEVTETTPRRTVPVLEPAPAAWPVSGQSAAGLAAQAARLAAHLSSRPDLDPVDVGWSLARTRSVFEHRAVITGDLASGLTAVAAGTSPAGVIQAAVSAGGAGRVGFLFAGQGAQRAGMGRELYAASPVFAEAFDHACALLEAELGLPIRDVVLGTGEDAQATQTLYAQTGLFAVEVGLVALLAAAGIVPDVVAGHSVGEIAAAHAAGVLTLAQACRLVAARARLMQALPDGGAMAAIAATEAEMLATLASTPEVSIAAVNGPSSTVISGDEAAVDAMVEEWRERGRRVRRLRVSHAFHSARMDPVLDELGSLAAGLEHAPPAVAWVGALTGELITRPDAGYWVDQARQPVRFADAVTTMAGQGVTVFVEIGPDGTLSAMGPAALPGASADAAFIPMSRAGTDASTAVLTALARAHVQGVNLDWSAVLPAGRQVDLPTYAFQHQHYWPRPAPVAVRTGDGTEAEARFWAAVEHGDLAGLAGALDVDGERPFSEVLPALASWRQRDREESLTAGWRYRVAWTPVPDPAPAPLTGTWLVVSANPSRDISDRTCAHAGELTRACAEALTKAGARVVVAEVAPGEVDQAALAARIRGALADTQNDNSPAISGANLQEGSQSDSLADSEGDSRDASRDASRGDDAAGTLAVAGVLSLLATDETPLSDSPAVIAGLAGTLGLVQALADLEIQAPLWVATSGAVATGPSETLTSPAQAQVWGLGRIVGLEHPDRWGGLIDLPPALDERTMARLVAVLTGSAEQGEDQIAIRGSGILGRRLLPAPQPRVNPAPQPDVSPAPHPGGNPALQRGGNPSSRPRRNGEWTSAGSALITGGTGAIGGRVAQWLAGRGVPRVVLVSRSGARASGAAERAARLAAAGTAVSVVACDTADRAQLAGLLDWVDGSGAALRAVFHASGVAQGAPVIGTTVADLDTAATAKTAGAAHLDELTAGRELDAFVLFSSGAAIWGSRLQAAYAAANAYLDALAENRLARGLPATSVSWGLWGGGGMGEGEGGAQLQRLGLRDMDPERAIGALATVLDHGEGLVTVADLDWAAFAPVFTLHRPSALISELPQVRLALSEAASDDGRAPGVTTELGRRLQGLAQADQDRILTDLVRAEAALVLGHPSPDAVEAGRAFKDVGFDSLTAVELRNRLNTATGLKLPATLVFDYPTPVTLAEHLRAGLVGEQAGAQVPVQAAATSDEPIAIVGMSCRLPGGSGTLEDFWTLLTTGTDAVSGFPADRGWEAFGSADGDSSFTPVGGFVYDAGDFDPAFFGISPREALAMDPQQRVLLETSWEALEQAGIDPGSLRGTTSGVFVGAWSSGYGMSLQPSADAAGTEGYFLTGSATSVISGRVAYTLGLEGPAVTVDTACSSSLVALHLACQSLRSGESSLALAGGVTVMATPGAFAEFAVQQGLAGDGRCKSFGAGADGTGWGEGAGVLVVERLSDARRNGHRVLAVVRGSAVNQDGTSNGLTAPNGPSQQRVIRTALAEARLTPADVDAVEAHGTGTVLGDPIEAQALLATYGQDRPGDRPLWLGSVKSNIGHTQAAAGVAGIIKMVLAMRHEVLPVTLHAHEPSPHVDWTSGEVRLLSEPVPWPANGRPRRAGVSSFGVSGTNAHVILEEPPAVEEDEPTPETDPADAGRRVLTGGPTAWVVSGRTAAGLARQAHRLAEYGRARTGPEGHRSAEYGRARTGQEAGDVADIGWSLATTRAAFEHRAVVTGTGSGDLIAGLAAVATGEPAAGVVTGTVPAGDRRAVFVFPGQGSQWVGMGRELAETSPVFAARLAECGQALSPYVDWVLTDVLAGAEGAPGLDRVDVVQPALWAVMVSLAAVWQAAGVEPDAVVGHSQGEIAAAVVAGILSLDDAAKVVALRSKALTTLSGRGGMLSIAEPADAVEIRVAAWDDRLTVAAVNGPDATVVSGDPDAIERLAAECERDGVRARILPVDYASHGPQVDELREEILELLAGVVPQPGRVPMMSAMTGELLDGSQAGAGYWYASLRAPVRFSAAIEALGRAGYRAFIESSPHPVLIAAITATLEQTDDGSSHRTPVVTGTLRRDDGGPARLLLSLAEAHVRGVGVNWPAVLPTGRPIDLPTYAFEHQRYWSRMSLGGAGDVRSAGLGAVGHPLLGAAVDLAGGDGVVLTGRLSLRAQPWLGDHAVGGTVLLPGTAFVEFAVRAGYEVGCARIVELTLAAPLVLPAAGAVQVQVMVGAPDEDGQRTVEIYSRADDDVPWTRHAGGRLAPDQPDGLRAPADFLVWPPEDAERVDVSGLYEIQAAGGYGYGPVFRGLRAAWRRGTDVFAEIALPDAAASDAGRFGIHPALLDASLHAAALLTDPGPADGESGGESAGVRLPFAWTGVSLQAAGAATLRIRLSRDGAGSLVLDGADPTGQRVVSVESLAMRPIAAGALQAAGNGLRDALFSVEWIPVSGPEAVPAGRWALIGADPFGIGAAVGGAAVESYPDLTALTEAIKAGLPAPDLVLAEIGSEIAPEIGSETGPEIGSETATAGIEAGRSVGETSRLIAGQMLGLVQHWLTLSALSEARLAIVTRGAIAARPGEPVTDLAASSAWGLIRSAQSEEPGRLLLVDLPADDTAQAIGHLPAAVASEEPELAIRERIAYGRRLTRPDANLGGDPQAGRPVGGVLITGGTGMLGALVSRHLAATGRAERLTLLSRSGPAASGAALLAADCAQAGAGVQITAGDAADRPALAEVLARTEGPLTAVVHTAGVLDDGVIGSLTTERIDAVMRPKADAAWNLHELTQGLDLDAFVLFSAGAATFGAPGQGNYAAGNAFLDSLAASRQAAGLPAISLAWGLWADASAMTGHLSADDRQRAGRSVMTEITADDGLALLDLALTRDEALLVPARLNVAVLRGQAARGERPAAVWRLLAGNLPRSASAAGGAEAGRLLRQQLNALVESDRDRILLNLVRTHAAAVLGHSSADAVGAGRAFKDLGFDSLTALELRNRLNAATGLKLPATLAFDYPTPVVLSDFIKKEIGYDQVSAGSAALDEISKLEKLVKGVPSGDGARTALAARVKALLLTLESDHDATADDAADNDLKAATAENIFDLLDNELAE